MFIKCAYIFDLIEKLEIPTAQKTLIESEINHLVNLIMFGDEHRPLYIQQPGEIYNQGEQKKW